MKLNYETPIDAVRELADNTGVSGDRRYPWWAASKLLRLFIERRYQDSDTIPEIDLHRLARVALEEVEDPGTPYDQDATPQFERFTPRYEPR